MRLIRSLAVVGAIGAAAGSAWAQPAAPAVATDAVVAVHDFSFTDTPSEVGVTLDSLTSIALGRRTFVLVRPFSRRLGDGSWINRLFQASVRHDFEGPIAVRLEGGVIPSPIGLHLVDYRMDQNATINWHLPYVQPLPPLGPFAPRVLLIAAAYPLGAQASASGRHWDLRTAVIDSSPVRPRYVFVDGEAPRAAQLAVGGGVTPRVGLRAGASFARGPYAHHEEFEGPAIPSAAEPAESYEEEAGEHYGSGRLSAAVATVEGEFAFGYTKLSGEWIHTILETPDRDVVARGWMAQAVRTLSPRWFVAVRGAHVSSPRLQPSVLAASALIERRLTFDSLEDVVGYRVAPELTVRLGHTAIKRYTTPAWDHQLGVSLVWSRRLW